MPGEEGEAVEVVTADGFAVRAQYFAPAGRARGSVVINAAMGVPQSYYAAFAAHLAARGFHALTRDYRGVGRSRSAPEPFSHGSFATWFGR